MKIETFAYLATPYAHKTAYMRDLRAKAALRIVGFLMKNRLYVFSPIVHNHKINQSGALKGWTHEDMMNYDAPFMTAASVLIVGTLPGWTQSMGIKKERITFNDLKKPELIYNPRFLFTIQEWSNLEGKILHTETHGEMSTENLTADG